MECVEKAMRLLAILYWNAGKLLKSNYLYRCWSHDKVGQMIHSFGTYVDSWVMTGVKESWATSSVSIYKSNSKNACTLVPTAFRWHRKMEFKFHLHFSFSPNFEKRIWTSYLFCRFRITLKNWFEFHFSFLHCLLLKNRLVFHLSFLLEFEKRINTPVIWNSPRPEDDQGNEGPFTLGISGAGTLW